MNGGRCPRLIPIIITNIGRLRLPFLFGVNIMKISVLGCGRWGSCIAWYLDRIGHDVSLYGRPYSARMKELMATRKNEHLHISDSLTLVTSYDTSFDADIIVFA